MIRAITLTTLLASGLAFGAVAQTKSDAPALPAAGAQETTSPSLKTEQKITDLVLTDQQANAWVGKPVYSSDNKKIGQVVAFARGADNVVSEMHADIGGFLGLGETRVKLTADQIGLEEGRIVLDATAAQAKDLPKLE